MESPATLDVLKGVRELLSDPARWTRDEYARTADGEVIDATNPNAERWCLLGAAIKVSGHEGKGTLPYALGECVPPTFRDGRMARVTSFNDEPETTHADVLAVLDCAIGKTESIAKASA